MISIEAVIHTVHLLAAGIWLGGLVFTTTVVSPAFKSMAWTPGERMAVRSAVGRQYAKVANMNLAVLLIAAIIDAASRHWTAASLLEIVLAVVILILAGLHGLVFAPRLAAAVREDRTRLLRLSVGVSMLNLLLSVIVMVLATGIAH